MFDPLTDLATVLRIALGMRWAFPTDSAEYRQLQDIATRYQLLPVERRELDLTNDSIHLQCNEDGGHNGN